MGENIAKLIDSHFSESIDMSEEQVCLPYWSLLNLHDLRVWTIFLLLTRALCTG